MTELTQAQIQELQQYAAGPKFVQLYNDELQQIKQLRARMVNEKQTFEKSKVLFANWQKEKTEKHEATIKSIQKRLEDVVAEVEKWKATEGARQTAELAHADQQRTVKAQVLQQLQDQITEVEKKTAEIQEKIEALKDPERYKRLKEIELEQMKQLEKLGESIENLLRNEVAQQKKFVPTQEMLKEFDALIEDFDKNLQFLDEVKNNVISS
jgi:molybdopterin converting factor small subunit